MYSTQTTTPSVTEAQPITFRLSPIDEPVPYAVTEIRERLHRLTRRCDELDCRIDAASHNLRAF